MKDLALLVADKNMAFTMRGILNRPESLGIQTVIYEVNTFGRHDAGVRIAGPSELALLKKEFRFGLIMFDWEGSGADADSPIVLERELDQELARTWGQCAKSIVIEPELEAWTWGSDNAMEDVLRWSRTEKGKIREWLSEGGYTFHANRKPARPKEALDALMSELRMPRSSAIYQQILSKISLAQCVDPAFNRLKTTLQAWFPVNPPSRPAPRG